VSGSEIRERLSALAASAPPPAEHAGESSSQLSSARQPDDEPEQSIGNLLGSAFSKFHQADSASVKNSDKSKRSIKDGRAALEDRTADINTGGGSEGGVESWGGLLAPDKKEQQRTVDSWDIHEAEKLLATSPASANNKHVQLPLGLVSSVAYPPMTCPGGVRSGANTYTACTCTLVDTGCVLLVSSTHCVYFVQ
jgi:hypothetical protein